MLLLVRLKVKRKLHLLIRC